MANTIHGPDGELLELRGALEPMIWKPEPPPEDQVALLALARRVVDDPINRAAVRLALGDVSGRSPEDHAESLAARLAARLADGTLELCRVGVELAMGGDAHSEAGGGAGAEPMEMVPRGTAPSIKHAVSQVASAPADEGQTAYGGRLPLSKVGEIIVKAYGKFLPKEKQDPSLVEKNTIVLSHEEFQKKILRGRTDPETVEFCKSVPGFYDTKAKKIYVDASHPDADAIVMHEAHHLYSSDRFSAKLGTAFDEGVTDFLAHERLRIAAKEDPTVTDGFDVGYPDARKRARLLSGEFKKEELTEAYFTGDVEKLKASYAKKHPQPDAWKDLAHSMGTNYQRDVAPQPQPASASPPPKPKPPNLPP